MSESQETEQKPGDNLTTKKGQILALLTLSLK